MSKDEFIPQWIKSDEFKEAAEAMNTKAKQGGYDYLFARNQEARITKLEQRVERLVAKMNKLTGKGEE